MFDLACAAVASLARSAVCRLLPNCIRGSPCGVSVAGPFVAVASGFGRPPFDLGGHAWTNTLRTAASSGPHGTVSAISMSRVAEPVEAPVQSPWEGVTVGLPSSTVRACSMLVCAPSKARRVVPAEACPTLRSGLRSLERRPLCYVRGMRGHSTPCSVLFPVLPRAGDESFVCPSSVPIVAACAASQGPPEDMLQEMIPNVKEQSEDCFPRFADIADRKSTRLNSSH